MTKMQYLMRRLENKCVGCRVILNGTERSRIMCEECRKKARRLSRDSMRKKRRALKEIIPGAVLPEVSPEPLTERQATLKLIQEKNMRRF